MKTRQDLIDTIGNTLQQVMDERGLSMAAVARGANVSIEVVRRLRDFKTIRRDKFFLIVNSLKLAPECILPAWNNKYGN